MYNSLLLFVPKYLRNMQRGWHTVYLSLGSNEGNSMVNIETALLQISNNLGTISRISPIYKTAAWGLTNQNDFLNLCIKITTPFSPLWVMQKIITIEKNMGRIRTQKWGPRIIDIDIVLFDQLILNQTGLQLPHPFFRERMFVLKPLNDIASSHKDPQTKKTIAQLLKSCEDSSQIKLYHSNK